MAGPRPPQGMQPVCAPMAAAAMTAYGRPSSIAAAAAVSAYMVKEEGSTLVEAANMPLATVRKKSRQWARAGG